MKVVSVAERRQAILDRVNEAGRVSVAQLSQDFGLSEVTIRQDLQNLAEGSLLLRTHGGAIAANATREYLSLNLRKEQQVQEKAHIGRTAAELCATETPSSSTAPARRWRSHSASTRRRYLTVITNGLAIAQELIDATGVTVVVVGGTAAP
jgi:DeoR family transcriptional regulator, aga operon transcriptional repressor